MKQLRLVKKTEEVRTQARPTVEEYWIIQQRFLFFFWVQVLRDLKGSTYMGQELRFNYLENAENYLEELQELRK